MKGYCYEPRIIGSVFQVFGLKNRLSNGGKLRRDYCLHFKNRAISRILFLSGSTEMVTVCGRGEGLMGGGGGWKEKKR